MNKWKRIVPLLLGLALLAGCGQSAGEAWSETPEEEPLFVDAMELEEIELEDEAVALAASPAAVQSQLLPVASGVAVKQNQRAVIDYSNSADGYVMVQFTGSTSERLKVQVFGPNTADPYKYNLTKGQWTVFPLSDGNGTYKVTVYERNPASGKYATVLSASFAVTLTDEFAPFLRPNQYVDYAGATNTLAQAAKLVEGVTDPLEKVENVYSFVVNNLTYDDAKANSVQSGYLPVLDDVLAAKKGICFDYAALMAGMLRSQGVPCKLVVGYAGTQYHAWISVWSDETGWIEGAIYFDGSTWHRMDPTFASSGNGSERILKYIGDGSNYTAKCFY